MGGARVREGGAITAGEDSGHPPLAQIMPAVPHGVDTAVQNDEASAAHSVVDEAGTKTGAQQLPPRNHSVLALGQLTGEARCLPTRDQLRADRDSPPIKLTRRFPVNLMLST